MIKQTNIEMFILSMKIEHTLLSAMPENSIKR